MREGGVAGAWVNPRPQRRLVLVIAALFAGVGVGTLLGMVLTGRQVPARLHAQYLPTAARTPLPAPDFTLRDEHGAAVSLHSLRGRTVLMTFMDPRCTTGCPIAGKELASIEGELDAARVPELLVISVAPDRTAADVEHFTSKLAWRPGWHWLLGSQAELAPVWAAYHVGVAPTADDVLHDQTLDIIDPRGRIRAGYASPLPIDDVVRLIQATQHTEVRT